MGIAIYMRGLVPLLLLPAEPFKNFIPSLRPANNAGALYLLSLV